MTLETRVKALALDVPSTKTGGWAALCDPYEIAVGDIRFDLAQSEAEDYRGLWELLDVLNPEVVVLEIPFLYRISQVIGVAKAWAATHHRPWWSVSAPASKKRLLNKGNASKAEVLSWAEDYLVSVQQPAKLNFHQADSLLYLRSWMVREGGSS